jgi:hypothetical protein
MVARWFAVAALPLACGLVVTSCSGEPSTEECASAEGCSTSLQIDDPTLPDCSEGPCKCADPDLVACCPFEWTSCKAELVKCRTRAECGIPGIACKTDADCPGPSDSRCGVGRCEAGTCELDILAWEAIPNQYPGDCKVLRCSPEGDVEEITNFSDEPDDGNPCTIDQCDGDQPVNVMMPDEAACPGVDLGVCVKGKCKPCWEPGAAPTYCPGGMVCNGDTCVPISCVNGVLDGWETFEDCGGPICRRCKPGRSCLKGSDCVWDVCTAGKCQEPTHTDGVKNYDETGVDCGYDGGPQCEDGEGCSNKSYCKSGVCYLGLCQEPSCTDTVQNGDETGPDCGGECAPCPD